MCTKDVLRTSPVAWTLFCALPLGVVSVLVSDFTSQDTARICRHFSRGSGPGCLSLPLLCLLLVLGLPYELHSLFHPKFSYALVKVCASSLASWCQTLSPTIRLPCSVRLMSTVCLWFLISDCLNYITWLLAPPRLQPGASLWALQHPCPVITVYADRCRQTDSSLFH